jgi:actin-related protein 6
VGLGDRQEKFLISHNSPVTPPYHSALSLTSSEIYLSTYPVTRAEYQEHGSSVCRRRFGGPAYNVNPPGIDPGAGAGGDLSDDERERRYAMGLESKKGKVKGKRKEEEEVTSGNWGGRRRRTGL